MEPISVGDRVIITGVEDGLKSAVGRVGTVRRVGRGAKQNCDPIRREIQPKTAWRAQRRPRSHIVLLVL